VGGVCRRLFACHGYGFEGLHIQCSGCCRYHACLLCCLVVLVTCTAEGANIPVLLCCAAGMLAAGTTCT
jgi:hypothetical protein